MSGYLRLQVFEDLFVELRGGDGRRLDHLGVIAPASTAFAIFAESADLAFSE